MANRRMFAKSITSSSTFLMLPLEVQAVYFQLSMLADDDGYCEYFSVLRMIAANEETVNQLATIGYLTIYEDYVLHITHWTVNNQLRSDRYTPSRYKGVKLQPLIDSGKPNGNQVATAGIPSVVKVSKGKVSKVKPFVEKSPKKRDIIDAVIKMWNSISNQNIHLTTESFRKQIRGRITELRKQDKDDESILNAFEYVFNNKKLQAEDDAYERFTVHDWNLTTLTRPKNFMKYLVEPEYREPELGYDPKDFEGDCNGGK